MPIKRPNKKVKKMPTKTVTSIKMSKSPRTLAANNKQAGKAISSVANKSYKKSFPSASSQMKTTAAMHSGKKVAAKMGRTVDWNEDKSRTISKIKKSPSKAVGYTTKTSSTSKAKKGRTRKKK